MKNLWIILAAAWLLSACGREPERAELTGRIEYDVLINNQETMEPWMNHVEQRERMAFVEFLFSELMAGKAMDSLGQIISKDVVLHQIHQMIPSLDSSISDPLLLLKEEMLVINTLRFREMWHYRKDNFMIEKKVLAIAPVLEMKDSTGMTLMAKALFWLPCDTSGTIENSELLSENIMSDAIIQNQLDVILNLDSTPPSWFFNLQASDRKTYFDGLLTMVKEKKTDAYNFFFQPLTEDEIEKLNGYSETMLDYDENNNEIKTIVEHKVKAEDFGRIKFAEKWEYSKAPFIFKKTTKAISPALIVMDAKYGVIKGFKPLFWVVFEDDYQEIMRGKYGF